MGKSVLKKMYSGMSAGMLSFFFAAVLFSAGCKNPVKNSSDSKKDPDLVLKELQIHRKSVNLKNWTVEIPEGKASVSAADVKAVFNISGVVLTIKEGTVSIEKGKTKKINLEAAPVKGKHKAWSQSVSVRRAEGSVSNLELKSLKIFGKAVNTDNWTVEIPEDNGVLVASNVEAVFNIPVENLIIEEGVIRLEKGEIKTATLKVAAVTGVHNDWSHAVSVKRAGEADLILKTLRIHKQNVDISNWTVEIPSSKAAVSSADVEAQFNITGAAVKVKNEPVSIASGATENVTLEVSAVAGKHKAWSQVVAVKRAKAATVNIIDIKGIYVDKKLVTNYAKTVELTKNSAEIKITVPANANYQTVTIDGKPAAYTASPDGTVFDSYTHTLTDIPAGEKEVIINITDTRFTPASLQKKIKLNYAGTSAYTPAKIKTVFIGDKDYTEENIDGAEAELTEGTPLTLDFKFIKAPPAGKEKIRVTVDSLSEEKAVAGNSVTFQFLSVTTGTHTVKIERLRADGNGIKTFNLTVKYLQKQKKITVESIEIKAGSENFIFDKKPVSQYKLAAMEYGNAEITTEADSIDMTINMEDPKDVSISVSNGAVQKNFKHGVKQAISLNRGGNNLKIEFTKSGFKTLIYKLNVKSDFVEISDITVAGTSYTWENFKALTAPIEVSSDKTDISVTWVNEGTPSRVSLEKKGSSNNLFSISGKMATAVNVPLIPGENEFTITVHFPELKWKRKTFKIKSMFAQNPDSNADFSEVVAEWYYQPPLNPQKAERPLSGEDVNVAVLYVKPESAEAKGVSLTKPASAVFSKTQYDGEQGWYKAEFNVRSGDKISYTITAKDGTVKAHNFNGGKGITMKKYLEGGYLRYGYHNDIDFNGGAKAVFDSAAYTAEINAESAKISNEGENKGKVFFIFKVFEFDGIEALSFAAPFKLEKDKGVKMSYRTYLISADLSGVNAGENVELDIPIKYNNVLSGKTTLIRTYKVKVNKH